MNVAVIPARGGSKRIPRKNIRLFCGRPIIAYSIQAALRSGLFERVIVSTDDVEIAAVARDSGAEVPFIRPVELADDLTGTTPVTQHAIRWLRGQGQLPEYACCIYATAPFVREQDLRAGWETLRQQGSEFAVSVTSFPYPVQRAVCLSSNGDIEVMFPREIGKRSQQLETVYHDAGQFYWGHADCYLETDTVFGPDTAAIVLPRHRVQDIDTEEDWRRAEYLYQALQMQGAVA
jgi:N-acylneuraminate cytidylyltransferase